MAFATGVAKQVVIVEEVTENLSPVSGGKTLRRVSSDLTLNKDSYQSNEILVSQQLRDARHGVRRPQGTFAGQISPGSFNDFWQGILRNNFAAGAIMATIDLALNTSAKTFTISSGFDAGGLKKEDVIVITGASSPNTALNSVRMRINSLTDTVITTRDLPTGLTTGSLTGVTITVVGKKLFIPPSGALFKSYAVEHWFSDVAKSELFTGVKFGQTSIQIPPTGLITFSSQMMGMDMTPGTARALTSPGAQSSSSSLAAVNGKISYANVDIGIVTGMTMQLSGRLGADPVVGANIVPHIFTGTFGVTGGMTILFTDTTISDTFLNEVEVSISLLLYSGATAQSDFVRFTLPRVKLMSNQKSDGDMALIQSFNYTALENVDDSRFNLSTLTLQDSLA